MGEPINPEAWRWYHRVIGKGQCPIMDTWWQTETGMFMITPLPVTPLKPGSATKPFPGIEADIYDDQGNSVGPGEEGYLVLKQPWPAMLRTIYKDPDRYVSQYWTKYPGVYFTGDSARRDEDGYFWIIGRVDDVIKVSGYRLGTAEIESALVSHPAVAEAAAIRPAARDQGQRHPHLRDSADRLRAIGIVAGGVAPARGPRRWPIARPESIAFVPQLPRRAAGRSCAACCAPALGLPEGDVTTLEE